MTRLPNIGSNKMRLRLLPLLTYAFSGLLSLSTASYDKEWCETFTKDPNGVGVTPYFFDDYHFVAEEIDQTNEQIFQLELTYSQEWEEFYFIQRDSTTDYWAHGDAVTDDLIDRVNGGACREIPFTDSALADRLVTIDKSGDVKLVSPKATFGWDETKFKRNPVEMEVTNVRNLPAVRYVTCSYDSKLDDTIVSQFYFLDTRLIESPHGYKSYLLKVKHKRKNGNGDIYEDYIVEYTDFTRLTRSELAKKIQLPEYACAFIDGPALKREPPVPPKHFSVRYDEGATHDYQQAAFTLYFEYHNFDYRSKIFYYIGEFSSKTSVDEKSITKVVEDYNTGYTFALSELTGWCAASIGQTFRMGSRDADGTPRMKTPEQYWEMGQGKTRAYLGQYDNRDIPTDTWQYTSKPDSSGIVRESYVLYLASKDWLRSQAMRENTFYPVMKKTTYSGKQHRYSTYYEYQTDPAYTVPDVSVCFHPEDIVVVRFALEADFYTSIRPFIDDFKKAFRNRFLRASGLVSPVRIPLVAAYPSLEVKGETEVFFKVLGRVMTTKYTPADYHELDPVPSFEAVENANKVIDEGTFIIDVPVGTGVLKVKAKAGTLEYLDQNTNFASLDNPVTPGGGGYSAGAMAGLGLGMLFVCAALGALAVYIYQRFVSVDVGQTVRFKNTEAA